MVWSFLGKFLYYMYMVLFVGLIGRWSKLGKKYSCELGWHCNEKDLIFKGDVYQCPWCKKGITLEWCSMGTWYGEIELLEDEDG